MAVIADILFNSVRAGAQFVLLNSLKADAAHHQPVRADHPKMPPPAARLNRNIFIHGRDALMTSATAFTVCASALDFCTSKLTELVV
jgi:hypothetical protein